MAVGNAIVQTAKFKPLSFQEWAAPLQVLNEAQAQNEATLSQLSAEADEYERYIREHPNDPISIQYNNYLNNIEKQATALANEGITPQSRTDLLNLYRDYNKTIKPVKTGVTAYQAYQQNRLKADDGTLLGPSLGVWDFIQNPEQQYNFVKGSTVQAEAAKAAASASARRRTDPQYKKVLGGQYYEISNPVGFTPEEVKAWVANPNTSPELTNIYNQLTEKYKDFSPQELSDYIVRGIYDGITYDNKITYQSNKAYGVSGGGSRSSKKGSGEEKQNPFLQQSITAPGIGEKSKVKPSLEKKMTDKPTLFINNTTGTITPSIPNSNLFPWINQNAIYQPVGKYQASAEYYRNNANQVSVARKTDDALVSQLNNSFNRNNRESTLKYSNKNISKMKELGRGYFSKFKSIDDITDAAKEQYLKSIAKNGASLANIDKNGKVVPTTQEQKDLLVEIGFSGLANVSTNLPTKPGLFSKKEFDELKKKGLKFYNSDGTPRTEEEIEWDAWDLLPHQYNDIILTTNRGAGKHYTESSLRNITPNEYKDIATGKKIKLQRRKGDEDKAGFSDYGNEVFSLNPTSLRNNKKRLKLSDGVHDYTIEVPLSQFDKGVINTTLRRIIGNLASAYYENGYTTYEGAMEMANISTEEFLKRVEMNQIEGINIEDVMDALDDELLYTSEKNFIPANSETVGKLYGNSED